MAKRLANIFFISLGIALACVVVFVLVLFLAPGLSIFGIKYIASGTHTISENCSIYEQIGDFNYSVRIETDEIPVQVVFSSTSYTYNIEYYDNYNGLTTSSFDDPSIKFSKEADGTAVVKITSFKKFIYENGNSSRYVKLVIPASYVSNTKAGETDLTVISKSSTVSFVNEIETKVPYFRNIKIETNGKVNTSSVVLAKNYSLKTINAIKITEDEKTNINAQNYILNSTGGKIVVDREVSGDINATTKNAKIQILSCNNFTANSGYGDIRSSRDDVGITINGYANITTTAGIIKIDSILGTSEKSAITTTSGNVEVKKAQNIDIKTTRGFVKISSAKNLNIETSSGSVTAEEATESVNVKTKRGKVNLGGDNCVLHNPTVTSTYGKVSVVSASGKVKIETTKANVSFVNKDANDITINVGGNLTASKLIGKVKVEVSGDASLDFTQFTANSVINGTGENSSITIKLLNNLRTSISYNLNGKDARLLEYNTAEPENSYQVNKSTNITSPTEQVNRPLLSATNAGSLIVYCKQSS